MKNVIVVGGGPAGIMAAITAADNINVTLLEKNEKIGKKLYITGKGRCNITNAKDISEFFNYIPTNPTFLYSSLYSFTNEDTQKFFESLGVPLKTERGDRVFPESDKSSDIINALNSELKRKNVNVMLNCNVKELLVKDNKITGVKLDSGEELQCDYLVMAAGGASYPQTGSTGDGYKLCKKIGHNIIAPKASLVPVEVEETWIKELQGLSLKNVELMIKNKNNKTLFKDFGEMLFTHFGISGPLVLSASSVIDSSSNLKVVINLKPALSRDELDKRIQKDFVQYINKDFKNALNDLLPQKLIPIIIMLSGIDENKKVNLITREERKKLAEVIQELRLGVKGLRPISEAIITSGGIDIKQVNSSTMRSKIIDNLYFAGEILDVDALTGGFNIQIALSTGYLAGKEIGN
jgi:predicted Rossmann fold flavoprotein